MLTQIPLQTHRDGLKHLQPGATLHIHKCGIIWVADIALAPSNHFPKNRGASL